MIDATAASIDIAIGGTLVPFLISTINQSPWSSQIKGAVAFVVCLAVGALMAVLHGTFTLAHWRDSAIAVTAASVIMYREIWKPSGIAPAVEQATTVVSSDGTSAGPSAASQLPGFTRTGDTAAQTPETIVSTEYPPRNVP